MVDGFTLPEDDCRRFLEDLLGALKARVNKRVRSISTTSESEKSVTTITSTPTKRHNQDGSSQMTFSQSIDTGVRY